MVVFVGRVGWAISVEGATGSNSSAKRSSSSLDCANSSMVVGVLGLEIEDDGGVLRCGVEEIKPGHVMLNIKIRFLAANFFPDFVLSLNKS